MVRALMTASLTILMTGAPAFAKTAEDLPEAPKSLADWVSEWEGSAKDSIHTERGYALLTRCAVVEKKEKAYKFIAVNPEKAVKQSLVETPEKTSMALAVEINSTITGDEDSDDAKINPCEKSLSSIAKCFNVDAVMDVTGPKWKLYRYVTKVKKMKMVFERPAGDTSNYFKWMQDQLAFDATILTTKGDFILALLPDDEIEKGAQALTIRNSARKFGLDASSRKGTSLISLEEQKGRYGMFKVVVASPLEKSAFAPGTKIILEKSKRVKMPSAVVAPGKDKSGGNDSDTEERADEKADEKTEEETQE
jgi:hypothetical protein